MGIVCLPGLVGKGFVAGQPGRRQSGGDWGAAGGVEETGISCQVRQVVSASTPPCLASPTSMRPTTLHCVILRGPPLPGRVRPRRVRRLGRHADEASGHAVSRPASHLPYNLSFLATSRIPSRPVVEDPRSIEARLPGHLNQKLLQHRFRSDVFPARPSRRSRCSPRSPESTRQRIRATVFALDSRLRSAG